MALPAVERGEAWHWSIRLLEAPDQLIGTMTLKLGERENRGFWIGVPWQRRGLASEACGAAIAFWFDVLKLPVLHQFPAEVWELKALEWRRREQAFAATP